MNIAKSEIIQKHSANIKMQFKIKATIQSLLISAFLFSLVQSECDIVINEINMADPHNFGKREFIELKSTCGDNIPLRGYKLIGFNCQSTSGTIDLIVTLWNLRTKNGFFTIGGHEVLTADLKVPSDYIKFKNSFDDKQGQTITSFFAKKDLRAIGLLYDKEKTNSFKDFTLPKKNSKINDAIIDQMKKYLIDLVVFGEKKSCDKCKIFERINHEFTAKKYILREFPNSNKDISLNRCAVESTGFLPEKFKLGNPTPGKENDCTGPHFLTEDYIPVNVIPAYVDDYDDSEGASCSNQPTCTAPIQPIDDDMIEEAVCVANATSTRDICTSLMLNPDGSNTAITMEQENSRKRHIGSHDHSEELEWQTTKFFR